MFITTFQRAIVALGLALLVKLPPTLRAGEPSLEVEGQQESLPQVLDDSELHALGRSLAKANRLEALLGRREESILSLRKAATAGLDREQMSALQFLAMMGDDQAAALAIRALRAPSPRVQTRAACILMRLKAREGYEPLLLLLGSSRELPVIKSAIAALGSIGKPQAAELIRRFLTHEDDSVRVNSAIALASLGSEEGIEVVLANLKSPDAQAQREATLGLGYFSDPRARREAEAIVWDREALWKNEAHIALARLKVQAAPSERRIVLLAAFLKHESNKVRLWAVDELLDSRSPEAVSALCAAAREETRAGAYARMRLRALGVEQVER